MSQHHRVVDLRLSFPWSLVPGVETLHRNMFSMVARFPHFAISPLAHELQELCFTCHSALNKEGQARATAGRVVVQLIQAWPFSVEQMLQVCNIVFILRCPLPEEILLVSEESHIYNGKADNQNCYGQTSAEDHKCNINLLLRPRDHSYRKEGRQVVFIWVTKLRSTLLHATVLNEWMMNELMDGWMDGWMNDWMNE